MRAMLEQLAVADPHKRRTALLTLLQDIGVLFEIETLTTVRHTPQNIRVVLQPGTKRIIIGAHYDAVPDSTGANDNAAGVAILLDILQTLADSAAPLPPLEFVFFDLEEAEMQGSLAYARHHDPDDIRCMMNVDLCGVGDVVVIADTLPASESVITEAIIDLAKQQSHIRRVSHLPPSDDFYFEGVGVPTVSVCCVPEEDIEAMQQVAQALQGKVKIDRMPTVFETMHNRSRDALATVELSALQKTRDFLLALLQQLM